MTEWMLEKYGPFMDVAELAGVLKIQKTTLYNQLYADKVDLPYVKRAKNICSLRLKSWLRWRLLCERSRQELGAKLRISF